MGNTCGTIEHTERQPMPHQSNNKQAHATPASGSHSADGSSGARPNVVIRVQSLSSKQKELEQSAAGGLTKREEPPVLAASPVSNGIERTTVQAAPSSSASSPYLAFSTTSITHAGSSASSGSFASGGRSALSTQSDLDLPRTQQRQNSIPGRHAATPPLHHTLSATGSQTGRLSLPSHNSAPEASKPTPIIIPSSIDGTPASSGHPTPQPRQSPVASRRPSHSNNTGYDVLTPLRPDPSQCQKGAHPAHDVLTPLRPDPTQCQKGAHHGASPSTQPRTPHRNNTSSRLNEFVFGVSQHSDSHSNLPTLNRSTTPTVHTNRIESGVTDDDFYHINQYIVEMPKWKRDAIRRRDLRNQRHEALRADRARRIAEGLVDDLDLDASAVSTDEDEDLDELDQSPDDDDEDEDATILGRGSYGVVKKVFNTQDGQFYAMKIISKSLLGHARAFGRQAADGDAFESVRREIAIMKRLIHPNIVRLVEVICDDSDETSSTSGSDDLSTPHDDNVYLVMDYAPGGCIMKVDMDEGEVELPDGSVNIIVDPLPVDLARKYFRDVLLGLQYLHFQKVVHRDIKPENILVAADGRALIADFGVSTLCEGDECLIASTAGTAVFMSPEMVASGAKSKGFGGPGCDVWSLGATLFFMLYGRLPWYARSLPEIYRQIREEPLRFPEGEQFAHIPPQARCLITGMLDKNPATRATIERMLQCPWVTDEGSWAAEAHCVKAGYAPAALPQNYQAQPLVAEAVCTGDLKQAVKPSVVKKDVPTLTAVIPTTITIDGFTGECTLLNKMRSRLATWKREMKRRCDANKAKKAAKRATMLANREAKKHAQHKKAQSHPKLTSLAPLNEIATVPEVQTLPAPQPQRSTGSVADAYLLAESIV